MVVVALLAASCAGDAPRTTDTPPGSPLCAGQPAETSGDAGRAAAEVRRAAEAAPLFAQLGASSPPASCRMTIDSGRVALEYTFGSTGTLRVTSDPRIEYSDQEARFATPVAMNDAVEILKRTEASAFSGGCGINWSQPDTNDQTEREALRETVFRGDTCNCRARVSRATDGRVIGLSFRSAC